MHFDPWTFGLQAANFLVLVWLLHRFLYRPVLAIMASRQAKTDGLMAETQAAKAAADALRASLESQRAAIASERDAALQAARDAGDAYGKAVLAKAHAEAESFRSDVQRTLEREQVEAVGILGRQAGQLAVAIVRRLLREVPTADVQARQLDLVLEDVAALPADDRARMAAGEAPLVITAKPLDDAQAGRVSGALQAAVGAPLRPRFQADPALLSGVELRFPYTILRRTWSDDLTRIETEIGDDGHAARVA